MAYKKRPICFDPLIYAIVCKGFKCHQQGALYGFIDATGAFAEMLASFFAVAIISIKM
ncbi:MAG: hypothetical protein HY072_09985 [Deltaproteobacteria bacterium]|nr:hypothetical protein [Deltaproteobacteria bacterium]